MTEQERIERRRASQRKYYAANKDKFRERSQRWIEAHRDDWLESRRIYQKQWRQAHPDKQREYMVNGYINHLKGLGYTIMKDGVEV